MVGPGVMIYSAPLSAKAAPVLQITGDYADGDSVGGVLTVNFRCPLKSGPEGPVALPLSLIVTDAEKNMPDLDVILFEAAPTITGDDAEFDPTSADLLNIVTLYEVRSANWQDYKNNAAAQVPPKANGCRVSANANQMWACIVTRTVVGWKLADSLNIRFEGVVS